MTSAVPILLLTVCSLQAQTPGSICVGSVAKPAAGSKSLSNPNAGRTISSFLVQIDTRPEVAVDELKTTWMQGLDRGKRHSVRVKGDGRQIASFTFTFAGYKSPDLCLAFSPLYETWTLREASLSGPTCRCK